MFPWPPLRRSKHKCKSRKVAILPCLQPIPPNAWYSGNQLYNILCRIVLQLLQGWQHLQSFFTSGCWGQELQQAAQADDNYKTHIMHVPFGSNQSSNREIWKKRERSEAFEMRFTLHSFVVQAHQLLSTEHWRSIHKVLAFCIVWTPFTAAFSRHVFVGVYANVCVSTRGDRCPD